MAGPVLCVKDFDVRFTTPDGDVHAVKNVSFDIAPGECLGVVGESGSGKSQLFLGIVGLLAGNGKAAGRVTYRGEELIRPSADRLDPFRRSKIPTIFPDPLNYFTPLQR